MENSILRYNPWALLKHVTPDNSSPTPSPNNVRATKQTAKNISGQWVPTVDISERKGYFLIQADLPGVKIEHVEIEMIGGVVVLKGHRVTKINANGDNNYFRVERSSGMFERRFSLPDTANPFGIKMEQDNGVYSIKIAKKEAGSMRKVAEKKVMRLPNGH